jgi:hypothetical protein
MRKEQWIALAGLGATIAFAVYMVMQMEVQDTSAPGIDQVLGEINESRLSTIAQTIWPWPRASGALMSPPRSSPLY